MGMDGTREPTCASNTASDFDAQPLATVGASAHAVTAIGAHAAGRATVGVAEWVTRMNGPSSGFQFSCNVFPSWTVMRGETARMAMQARSGASSIIAYAPQALRNR